MTETTKITSIMGEILNLIKYKFKIEFDEDSFEFTRFVTHIRYFIMRQVNNKPLENENSDMFTLMQDKLTEELECVEMIEKHLNKNYGWNKFKIEFDEDSFEFTRFVTHIRYFIMRQVNNKPLENENSDMFTLMQDKLTEELECVEMIEKYLNKNYGWKCTNDEKLYLMLHIQRIRKQNN